MGAGYELDDRARACMVTIGGIVQKVLFNPRLGYRRARKADSESSAKRSIAFR
jgi:hypothetical protein